MENIEKETQIDGAVNIEEINIATNAKKTYEIKIINSHSSGWYGDVKITIDGEVYRIKEVSLNSVDNFKIHGMITSYHSYVDYYNKLIMLTSIKPESIEYLNKVNDVDVLKAIEEVDISISYLRERILDVESEIHNMILSKILSGDIVIEKLSVGTLFKDFINFFKIKQKIKPKTYIATL